MNNDKKEIIGKEYLLELLRKKIDECTKKHSEISFDDIDFKKRISEQAKLEVSYFRMLGQVAALVHAHPELGRLNESVN